MSVTAGQVEAGQAIYTKSLLSTYDWFVLRFSNRVVWKCPSHNILALYNQHVSNNHLDVGVGTGFFLDRCYFPSTHPRLALFDLNPNSLEFTARRMARFQPETYRMNVLEPIVVEVPRFDSVGMNYLLHCLPGTIQSKAIVFEHLKSLMNHGGVLFGATLLHEGVKRSWLAKRFMKVYNTKGIFTNTEDNLDGLKQILKQHFSESSVEVIGSAALFWGKNK